MKRQPPQPDRIPVCKPSFLAHRLDRRNAKPPLPQYAGRLHHLHDMKKKVQIYDYVDADVPVLVKMYKRRLAGYKAIGYEIKE